MEYIDRIHQTSIERLALLIGGPDETIAFEIAKELILLNQSAPTERRRVLRGFENVCFMIELAAFSVLLEYEYDSPLSEAHYLVQDIPESAQLQILIELAHLERQSGELPGPELARLANEICQGLSSLEAHERAQVVSLYTHINMIRTYWHMN